MTNLQHQLAILFYRDNYKKYMGQFKTPYSKERQDNLLSFIAHEIDNDTLEPYSMYHHVLGDFPSYYTNHKTDAEVLEYINKREIKNIGTTIDIPGRIVPFKPNIVGIDPYTKLPIKEFLKLKEFMATIPKTDLIAVIGDYDCDGVVSQTVTITGLRDLGYKVFSLSNNRKFHNGFNDTMFERLIAKHKQTPIKVLFLTDHGSGIEDVERIKKTEALGINVVVLDHHEVNPHTKEVATIFINSRETEYQELCAGALCWHAMNYLDVSREVLDETIQYAHWSLSTDFMDLEVWYNLLTYKHGEVLIRTKPNLVVNKLKSDTSAKGVYNEDHISYKFGPLVNAPHRLNRSKLSVDFLSAMSNLRLMNKELGKKYSDDELAFQMYDSVLKYLEDPYDDMVKLNKKRRRLADHGLIQGKQAYYDYKKKYPDSFGAVIQIEADEGIIGIISSSLGKEINNPVISMIMNDDKTMYIGSARSTIKGFNILKVLKDVMANTDTMIGCGGHPEACGCKVAVDKMDEWVEAFTKEMMKYKGTEPVIIDPVPYPTNYSKTEIYLDFINHQPYGKLDKPLYYIDGDIKHTVFGINEDHIKIHINGMELLYFNGVRKMDTTKKYKRVAFTLGVNTLYGGLQYVVEYLGE